MRIVIVSGLSGSGKSVALHTLEDEGFYCVDNMPSTLIPDLMIQVAQLSGESIEDMAVGIDARSVGDSLEAFTHSLNLLKEDESVQTDIVFLETNQATLIKRFSETRRKHPLTSASTTLVSAIEREVELLGTVKLKADLIIDTSALNLHQLREIIKHQVVSKVSSGPALQFQSFGFKHGAPTNTDFVFDVRCLPNPYWKPALRALTGKDEHVIDFLGEHDSVENMLNDISGFLNRWLPTFQQENRAYLTVSIGCTGGRHRSVYLAEKLCSIFSAEWDNVSVAHREIS